MFYNILDKKRKEILPLFKTFEKDFYLAGGTALALQIGHRDSVDFDFFTQKEINTKKLYEKIKEVFKDHQVLKNQEEKNTLTVTINNSIKVSFFTYKTKMINPLIKEDYFNLASLEDIACMKLSAITSRATNKDYIDIYFILQRKDLADLLNKTKKKLPDISLNLILKSLIFFKDIEIKPIKFKNKNKVSFNKVKTFIKRRVSEAQTI